MIINLLSLQRQLEFGGYTIRTMFISSGTVIVNGFNDAWYENAITMEPLDIDFRLEIPGEISCEKTDMVEDLRRMIGLVTE